MAQAQLIFDENTLDKSSPLYDLYSRLYNGMNMANQVDAPDFSTDPPMTPEGEIDAEQISSSLLAYSTILMKNSAYMMANSIVSAVDEGGIGGDTSDCISRSGDSMEGLLGALHGFEAGYDNTIIFDTAINAGNDKIAHIYGQLIVDEKATIKGELCLSDKGIYMSDVNVISYANDKLVIASQDILLNGKIEVSGSIEIGSITVNENGIYKGENEFYHSGNANLTDIDWAMRDALVNHNLIVKKNTELKGVLTAIHGFSLGAGNEDLLYSVENEHDSSYIQLSSDLSLLPGYGVKLDGKYIINVRRGDGNIVSFSAPGMIMNLGDSDGDVATTKIALQTGIYNHNNDYRIISQYGDGNFPNSFSAGCANSGATVLQTYYKTSSDCGVIVYKKARFGSSEGPCFCSEDPTELKFIAPYIRIAGNPDDTEQIREDINSTFSYKQTSSPFRDQSMDWSASLLIDTQAEFITLNKPTESTAFCIISNKYKTRLSENALFFDDAFIEGTKDGMSYSGNAYFTGSVSSKRFASGFSGYGWNIGENALYGGVSATFDELTIRKKMRIYELEVQKSYATNGSLWISDSCAGDLVEEID